MRFCAVGAILLCVVPVGSAAGEDGHWFAAGFSRKVIYHSPQTPGYTSWVGAWQMPDGSLMTCFTQVTGPAEGRGQAPEDLWRKLGMPSDRRWDFTGLSKREIYLRSTDGGSKWQKVSESEFGGAGAGAYAGGATACVPGGDVLRRVNGWDLMGEAGIPQTAYLQRSRDGGRTWGEPMMLLDPRRFTYQISRIRPLRDGQLVATGQVWETPAGSSHAQMEKAGAQLLAMTSADGGKTWRRVQIDGARRDVAWDEWDLAQTADGNLLCVFRRGDPKNRSREVRWQGVIRTHEQEWALTDFRPSPLPHSGHPELLATREGPVLYFATTGVMWTDDTGANWHRLQAPGAKDYKTRYYPRSLQGKDGTVYVFAHNGSDNWYGQVDQSVVMDRFRLSRVPATEGGARPSAEGGR